MGLADAARDELGVLRAEVDDEDPPPPPPRGGVSDVGALEHRVDLLGVPVLRDPRDDRNEAGEQVEDDPLEVPRGLDAEVRDRRSEDHVDEAVDVAPVLGQEVGLLESVLRDHLGDEDEQRDTGDERHDAVEAQRRADLLRLGHVGGVRAHVASSLGAAGSEVAGCCSARNIFHHIQIAKRPKTHHWTA